MIALDEIREYLYEKISNINTNNPKANAGGRIIKLLEWEDSLPALVSHATSILQFQFTRTNKDNDAGKAQLTATSTMIGKYTLLLLDPDRFDEDTGVVDRWKDHIAVGDLFIEAFKVLGFVTLEYSQTRDGSYIIVVGDRWTDLRDMPEAMIKHVMVGTSLTPPPTITQHMQRADVIGISRVLNLVKGSKKQIELDVPWVRAMDKLQQVKWRINRRVLKALLDNKDLFVSEERSTNEAKEIKRKSKLLEWEFITKKANILNDCEEFYQYLEADYRGRLYYAEPFLNFQGSDIARGMLRFAKAKEITEQGLQWMAIHTASSYNMSYGIDEIPDWCEVDYKSHLEAEGLDNISVDKMTLADRIEWCNEHMESIISIGRDPRFNMEAEKPVSFLACCIEWADYEKAFQKDEPFYTSLPIPIDGSNNGWQHLGAMSKDEKTGELVGLVDTQIQKDFYVQTAKELKSLTVDKRLSSILKKMPMKHIRKGISKRGSMTRAYSAGAGKIGQNMWFDCRTEDFHDKYKITEADCMQLAKILVKAIDNVCPGPLDTMAYLQELAGFQIGRYKKTEDGYELVSGKGETSLSWITPSEFNVEYKNWLHIDVKHRATLAGKQIKHVARLASNRPDVRGFMCGISPNYIHSMDAAHMAVVIDRWEEDFCAVHDSFATHASDVGNLVDLTKEVFIEIYDVDNYFDIIRQSITNNEDDVEKPDLGSLDIQEIRNSDYFFA